jgi:hypothetical protein
MPKYTVRRLVDAYVVYEAEVEAPDAEHASIYAREDETEYEWEECCTNEFDARNFVTLNEDGGEIEETQVGDM